MQRVVFVQGGGVGLDQEASLRRILGASGVAAEFEVYAAGRAALEQGRDALPEEMLAAVREAGFALKTKLHQPKGAGTPTAHGPTVPKNYNVEFRRRLGLYASARPVHGIPGVPARFPDADFLLVREITEDLYATTEHEIVPGVVQSFKIVTEAASLRFFRLAFRLAERTGRKKVHCIHKANILKMADGLYLDCFRRVAAEFPAIQAKDMIVDNACMQMVSRPGQFEVVAAGNLYGDLLGDLGAGLVGGVGTAAAVNHGDGLKVYEAVAGATHERVPPGRGNPLPLVLAAVEMLRDQGLAEAALRIEGAVGRALMAGSARTADLGGTAGAEEFTAAVCAAMQG